MQVLCLNENFRPRGFQFSIFTLKQPLLGNLGQKIEKELGGRWLILTIDNKHGVAGTVSDVDKVPQAVCTRHPGIVLIMKEVIVHDIYLLEVEKHLGEEMKKVFRSVNKYPESKKDIQALFVHTAERILGIINVDWVTLKIVDVETGNSLHEYFISRGRKKIDKVKIDNKELLNGECSFGSCSIVKSNQENFNIKYHSVRVLEVVDLCFRSSSWR